MDNTNQTDYSSQMAMASTLQKGQAAELRTFVDNKADYQALSYILHSGDDNPHKYGHNPFADSTNSYDPKAQEVIDRI